MLIKIEGLNPLAEQLLLADLQKNKNFKVSRCEEDLTEAKDHGLAWAIVKNDSGDLTATKDDLTLHGCYEIKGEYTAALKELKAEWKSENPDGSNAEFNKEYWTITS